MILVFVSRLLWGLQLSCSLMQRLLSLFLQYQVITTCFCIRSKISLYCGLRCRHRFLSQLVPNFINILKFTLLFLSSPLYFSALFIISYISLSERPPELWIVIWWSLPVALSLADTFTIPFASMSKPTSIYGTPRGAGGIPDKSNYPNNLLSVAISLSPWKTRIETTV